MTYATATDYVADPKSEVQQLPTGGELDALEARLQDASDRVDELTLTATYRTDWTTGLPVDPVVVDAFKRATIRQAQHMQGNQDGSDGNAYGAAVLGPLSLPAVTGQENRYSAEAVSILRSAGLITARVARPGWPWW